MKLGRTTKIWQNFFYLSLFSSTPNNQNSAEFFVPSAHFIILDTRFHLFMVQPVSAIFILIGLGFRFYSRQSITYGSTRPPSFSIRSCALRIHYVFLHSSFYLVLLLRHPVHDSHCSSFLAILGVPCIQCSRWV